jgi:hypothetical protein
MTHDGEQVAAGRSVLLIKREVKVLDLINFSLPLPRLNFHPGESVDRAHGDMVRLFAFAKRVRFIFGLILLLELKRGNDGDSRLQIGAC